MNVKKYLASSIVCLVTLFHGSQAVQAQQNNGFFIINSLSGRCIDVGGAPGTGNGAPLQLYDCELSGFNRDNGSPTDQKWEFIGGGFIRNTLSGKCIDVDGAPGTVNGGRLQLFDCELSGFNGYNGSPTDQRWEFIGGGFIRNTLSGRCIDVNGAPGTGNGAPLQLFDCESSGFNGYNGSRTDQTWRLSF
ncbi:MAG: RICIN domain-containing protein [Nostoc sp. CmiVER01]|uniref:RICIN domain-containing protein n=1 Tax=Nostoc sp. CmiVER01 TaxID=3075384 RepID=UPI002AD476B1|nr:RICIN domain-containing protein [Nostoc sp. CmiVER01]MDZ8124930.1 RICIN domain-containing protein [Nostoc sp. CmiVER01]